MKEPVTAVVPACNRKEATLRTLAVIASCDPAPVEVIVHIDGGNNEMEQAIQAAHPAVKILKSDQLLGPGGSRNALVHAAQTKWVANFDDDSFPETPDYFARIQRLVNIEPLAAMFSAASQPSETQFPGLMRLGVFSGCGCVYNKEWFMKTQGYVPLPIAYCMEEVDLSLQLHALGGIMVHDPELRVVHDRKPVTTPDEVLHAGIIANTALLPFLRFPIYLWPVGLLQLASRIVASVRAGWHAGLLAGIFSIPRHLFRHRRFRKTESGTAVISWLILRRSMHPLVASGPRSLVQDPTS